MNRQEPTVGPLPKYSERLQQKAPQHWPLGDEAHRSTFLPSNWPRERGGFHSWVEQSSATTAATGPATATGPASTRAPSDSTASAAMAAVVVVMASAVEPRSPVPRPIVVTRVVVVPTTARREIHAIPSYIEIGQYKDHNQEYELYNPAEKQADSR